MNQSTASIQPPKASNAPEKYTLGDHYTTEGCTFYHLRVDSDEGRAYAKLSTDDERRQYMRLHAHDKMETVYATWHFYEDHEEGREYLIRINSPEGVEIDRLIGDSDEELEEGSKREEDVARYFKEHAHEVKVLEKREMCCPKTT